MPKRHVYQIEWDPIKARENIKKHKIVFERAATVFLDAAAASLYDDEHSADEDRWITLGIDKIGVLLCVHHTFREESGPAHGYGYFQRGKQPRKKQQTIGGSKL